MRDFFEVVGVGILLFIGYSIILVTSAIIVAFGFVVSMKIAEFVFRLFF